MSTENVAYCPECEWTGPQTDLDDSRGEPQCPNCGRRVVLR